MPLSCQREYLRIMEVKSTRDFQDLDLTLFGYDPAHVAAPLLAAYQVSCHVKGPNSSSVNAISTCQSSPDGHISLLSMKA